MIFIDIKSILNTLFYRAFSILLISLDLYTDKSPKVYWRYRIDSLLLCVQQYTKIASNTVDMDTEWWSYDWCCWYWHWIRRWFLLNPDSWNSGYVTYLQTCFSDYRCPEWTLESILSCINEDDQNDSNCDVSITWLWRMFDLLQNLVHLHLAKMRKVWY